MPPAEPKAGPRGTTRPVPWGLLVLAGLLLAARVATGVHEQVHPPTAVPRVQWRAVEQADSLARAGSRLVLYDFNAGWCAPCRAMEREVFSDEAAAGTINALFVPVSMVDLTRERGGNPALVDSLQRRFKVRAFPTLVVFSPETGRHESAEGYQGRRQTLHFLQSAHGRLWRPPILRFRGDPSK